MVIDGVEWLSQKTVSFLLLDRRSIEAEQIPFIGFRHY